MTSFRRFFAPDFGDTVACRGPHVARALEAIMRFTPGASWYAADVIASSAPGLSHLASPGPIRIDDLGSFLIACENVDQFESAVVAGVASANQRPRFRPDGLHADEPDDAPLLDALFEVRAFDWTYILVASVDAALTDHVVRAVSAA